MRDLRKATELEAVAKAVVWYEAPADALADPVHFVLHALEYGTADEMALVLRRIGREGVAEALADARPGIMSPPSWQFWHLWLGNEHVPALPARSMAID